MIAGTLEIQMFANIARISKDMTDAKSIVGSAMASVETSVERAKTALSGLALGFGVAGILRFATSTIDAAEQLGKMSQKIGISVESLSELKFGAHLADVDIDSLGKGLKFFNVALVEATNPTSNMAKIFKALAVDIKAGPDEALRQFAQAVSLLADGELKTALATQVLGKAGLDLIPWLNAGRKGMEDSAEQARRLGLVLSKETAKAAEELNDNLKRLGTGAQELGFSLLNKIGSGLVLITNEMVKAKEKGNLLLGTLRELDKLGIAFLGDLFGGEFDKQAQRAFANRGGDGALNGPSVGRIRRPDGEQHGPQIPPDILALRRALNQTKIKDMTAENDRLAKKKLEEQVKFAQLQLDIQEDDYKLYLETKQLLLDRDVRMNAEAEMKKQIDNAATFGLIDAEQERAIKGTQDYLDAIQSKVKETNDFTKDLGFTFTSAFESAVISGNKLSDVLKGLARDIAQIAFRKTVTKPLADAFGQILASSFGGGRAGGGPVSASHAYVVGERGPEIFTPNTSGNITPNGGGGRPVIIQFNIQALDSRSVVQVISQPQTQRAIRNIIEGGYNANGASSGMAPGF